MNLPIRPSLLAAPTGSMNRIWEGDMTPRPHATIVLGSLSIGDAGDNAVFRISVDGVTTTTAGTKGTRSLSAPTGMAVDAAGNVFVTRDGNNAILKTTLNGDASTFADKAGAMAASTGPAAAPQRLPERRADHSGG